MKIYNVILIIISKKNKYKYVINDKIFNVFLFFKTFENEFLKLYDTINI